MHLQDSSKTENSIPEYVPGRFISESSPFKTVPFDTRLAFNKRVRLERTCLIKHWYVTYGSEQNYSFVKNMLKYWNDAYGSQWSAAYSSQENCSFVKNMLKHWNAAYGSQQDCSFVKNVLKHWNAAYSSQQDCSFVKNMPKRYGIIGV